MRYLYSIGFYLYLPVIFVRLWWKGRKNPAYRDLQGWAQRLGFVKPLPAERQCIWIHAVSVGEMIAARPLVQALRRQYPEKQLLITNMTPTGLALARQLCDDQLAVVYVPYDVPDVVQRFLRRVQPELVIIMETELWPNLVHYTAQRGVPIMLANARLSARSAQGYARMGWMIRPMLQQLRYIMVQSQPESERFLALGAKPEQLVITGSIKFDVPVPVDLVEAGVALRASWGTKRPVFIAASTHGGEEEKILRVFAAVAKVVPEVMLILVPRHSDRFDAVAALCEQQGFSVVRRSQGLPCTATTQIFLGDTLGELFLYYAAADLAFVGGSLVPIGGHNLLEPAMLGLPVITGPHIFNFQEIYRLLTAADALIKVDDEVELPAKIVQLLQDETQRQKMGANAKKVVANNHGALAKHIDFISQLLRGSQHAKC